MTPGSDTAIDVLYREHQELRSYLEARNELGLRRIVETNYPKVLAVSAGGYFEERITGIIMEHVASAASNEVVTLSLVRNKAIARQYHTFFVWDGNNGNTFYGLFGEDFKRAMSDQVKESKELEDSVRAFLRIGNLRNEIAHSDFANYPITYTADEIYEMYQQACKFVDEFAAKLQEFLAL